MFLIHSTCKTLWFSSSTIRDNPFWKDAIALALCDMLVTEQSYGALGKLEATDEVTLSVVIGVVVSAFVVPLSGIGEVAIGAELTELRITNNVKQKQNRVMMNVVTVIQTDDLEVLQLLHLL